MMFEKHSEPRNPVPPDDDKVINPYPDYQSNTIADRNERLEICKKCEFITPNKFCRVCKCWMPAKTYFKGLKCPMGKW